MALQTMALREGIQKGAKRTRTYQFTPLIDDLIRLAYRQYRFYGNRQAISHCARKVEIPSWKIRRRAVDLGLTRTKEQPWSEAEVAELERWGHLTDAVIQRKLKTAGFSRTIAGIHLKLKRIRIRQNLDGYSAYSLSEAFGVDSHKVELWIRRKMLHATRRGTDRTQGGDSYWINHDAVREFVYRHPDEIDLARVEKLWFLDLVSAGRIGAY
jgi:hypothetical protein